MNIERPDNTLDFLSASGELGKLTREKDWSKTSLGDARNWPQSLRTTLSIILRSKFPMFLFWGEELNCFYNDPYRPSLGNDGKHPSILGMPGKDAWPEIWSVIKPLIDQVLSTGEATWSEDQLIPIYRNGKIEDVYWTFSYSPVNDESGERTGVFVTCVETTRKVKVHDELASSKAQLESTIKQAPVAMCIFRGPGHVVEIVNARMLELWGKRESDVVLKPIFEGLPEAKGQGLEPIIDGVFKTGIRYEAFERPVKLPRDGKLVYTYINFVYEPVKEIDGTVSGIIAVASDVTLQVLARKRIELSEARVRDLIMQLPIATVVLTGRDHVIETANNAMLKRWNKTAEQIFNKKFLDVFPTLKDQRISALLDQVFVSGKPYRESESISLIADPEKTGTRYVDFEYSPVLNTAGEVAGIIATVEDVTDKVYTRKRIEESEKRYHHLIYSSPSAIGILYGEDLVVTIANDAIIAIWGKGKEIMGKAYFEALPELAEQGYREVFAQVYKTGVPFNAVETPVNILQDGKMQLKYYNFLLYPQRNFNGEVDGIGIIATEVTSQALLNKQILASEKRFRLLADSMAQHIWTSDPEGQLNYFNQSVYDYSGYSSEQLATDGWLQIVHPDDREANVKAWTLAISTGNDFILEHRFRRHDGEYRWQLSRAVPQKDENGVIRLWVGTSTDIQDQKTFTNKLEKEVEKRTKELARSNEELSKMNKELQSFAYISSHDLQEPLRKIQTFASRIGEIEYDKLSDKGKDYFVRMKASASRMQTLIQDLLAYSRTNTTERKFETVDLHTIVTEVAGELKEELLEKNVTIEADPMCEARVIPFQFRQLLHNLISNSLKFAAASRSPVIHIHASKVSGESLNDERLLPYKSYCHIRISDNGIGFDQQYNERIFELFQRLHGRTEYDGTGIGLAIVKKIVENHHGVIVATGEANKGARFDVYLPD